MSIFEKVTVKSLKKNKVRTLVTIVGIILSTALFTSVTTAISTGLNYVKENYIYADGSWHGNALDVDKNVVVEIKSKEEVEEVVYNEQIGHSFLENSDESKPYLYVIGASEGFENILPVHLTSGVYPSSPNEILLPNHLLDNGGLAYKVGDELTLNIGQRVVEGEFSTQSTPYFKDENLQIEESLTDIYQATYTIVGFYEKPNFEYPSSPGYTAITLIDENNNLDKKYDVYFKLTNPKDIYSFMENNKINGYTNEDVLMLLGANENNPLKTIIYGAASVIIALIMFGSIALIYNSFSISVSERTKQFGLLSSIGATKSQLMRMVLFEALVIGLIGIPIGILIGVGGLGLSLELLSGKLTIFSAFSLPLKLKVSVISIIAACVIALVTILLSALIPALRATKISAIEAIRQQKDIKAKPVKTSKFVYKSFGLSGVLADKNFKRNKKRYRATIISLFMSIVLFISTSSFSSYLMSTVNSSFNTASFNLTYYDFDEDSSNISKDELLIKLENVAGVTNGTYLKKLKLGFNLPNEIINERWLDDAAGSTVYVEVLDESLSHHFVSVNFIEDNEYKEFLKDNNLNESIYFDKNNLTAVALDGHTVYSISEKKYISLNMLEETPKNLTTEYLNELDGYYLNDEYLDENGNKMCRFISQFNEEDEIIIPREEAYTEFNLNVGTIIYEKPYFIDTDMNLNLLYPMSLSTLVMSELVDDTLVEFLFTSNDHQKTYEEMKDVLQNYGLSVNNLYDYANAVERSRDIVLIVKVFSYGFIALISLIAIANVFNTISTNIALRRKEFAMLKSVGMTNKDFNKMMNYECILYGSKSLLFGIPVSILISYLIYLVVAQGVDLKFVLPWQAILISIAIVFLVVFITMIYSVSKIKKENPIDALKNENI